MGKVLKVEERYLTRERHRDCAFDVALRLVMRARISPASYRINEDRTSANFYEIPALDDLCKFCNYFSFLYFSLVLIICIYIYMYIYIYIYMYVYIYIYILYSRITIRIANTITNTLKFE